MLVREVAAAKSQIAPNGAATEECFEAAAKRAKATRRLTCPVRWKSVKDRYKRIQALFDEHNKVDGFMSGVFQESGRWKSF